MIAPLEWRATSALSRSVGQHAAHQMTLARRSKIGRGRDAIRPHELAARGEAAARRNLAEIGRRAGDGLQPLASHAVMYRRGEQAAAIRVLRRLNHLTAPRQLDDLAGV